LPSLFPFVATALANSETAPIEIGMTAASGSGEMSGLSWVILAIVLAAVIMVGIWSSGSSRGGVLAKLALGPSAQNLFLGLRLAVGPVPTKPGATPPADPQKTTDHNAFLRSISLKGAQIVIQCKVIKGQRICLHLDSLPGFPGSGESQLSHDHVALEGSVRAAKSLGGNPESLLADIMFGEVAGDTRQRLLNWLGDLNTSRRVLNQA